jgi:CspA family cold shock protein
MKGKVKWYNTRYGYGLIRGKDGEDAFVHKSQVPFWTIFLNPGDKVEYNKEYTTKGLIAKNIKVT